MRAVLYPTIKLGDHWTVVGALEAISNPYDPQDFSSTSYGIRGRVLLSVLEYSQVWNKASLVVRAGQMPSTFGSFILRYDDADNPLLTAPAAYGYYYDPVSTLGLAGVLAEVTAGKWDARAQLANSSPANPRSIFDKDQYGNWAGGIGYSVRQGLRIGASAYHGPYLDQHYPYYFPGEIQPSALPATGVGIDADWAAGHWNVRGEWQRYLMTYRAIPDFRQNDGYVEAKRVLNARWFVAGRVGYLHTSVASGNQTYEGAVGFRAARYELIKAGYWVSQPQQNGETDKAFLFQFVTSVPSLSKAWK